MAALIILWGFKMNITKSRSENLECKKKKVKQVLRLTAQGIRVDDACRHANISKPTYYHWKRWVESLETENHNFINMYTKRLQVELQKQINCKKLIETIFQTDLKKPKKRGFSSKQIYQILSKLESGSSYREVAKIFDTSHTTIVNISKNWELR